MNGKKTNQGKNSNQSSIVYDRYIKLLSDSKIWIILITALFSALWLLFFPEIYKSRQEFSTTAIIRFDDPGVATSASGVDDRFSQLETESKISIIETRSFLISVVDSLKLNIVLSKPRISRLDLIKSLDIKQHKNFGVYNLKKKKDEVLLFYTDKINSINNEKVSFQDSTSEDSYIVNTENFRLRFNLNTYKKYDEIEFAFIPSNIAANNLKESLNLKLTGKRQTLLYMSYRSNDIKYAPIIVNTISGIFLNQLLDFKQSRTKSVISSLEEQLVSSETELENIEQKIKVFHEQNPYVYINQNLTQFNSDLSSTQNKLDIANKSINQLQLLLNEKKSITKIESRNIIYREIISFLLQQDVPGTAVLDNQYSTTMSALQDLYAQNFSIENPRVNELNKDLESQQKKIDDRARQFLLEQEEYAKVLLGEVSNSERTLKRLPREEMELIRLQREREAKSTIYSNVLRRYNEAKVAHASIAPDAYLLEEAAVPIGEMNYVKFLVLLAFGPIIGMLLGVSLFITIDIFFHKARSIDDIENTLDISVIATIPSIKEKEDKDFDMTKKVDSKLVTIDYSPRIEGEAFRNLRTKLALDNDDHKQKIIVTSFAPGEGKSLIASNLAVTFAQLKRPTVIIDGDLRRGVQHNTFLCTKVPGLSDALGKNTTIDERLLAKIVQSSTIPNLFIIPCGTPVPNPTELIMSEKLGLLLNLLEQKYSYIIIDTPPIEIIPDALVFNKLVNKILFTIRYNKTNLTKLKKRLNEFSEIEDDYRGIVFNGTKKIFHKDYYSYSYYKY
jgi:capsular exopolysaccharide synthesis family protein